MNPIHMLLPGASDAGTVRRWYLPINDGERRDAETEYYQTYARFLGVGTSHTDHHQDHNGQPFIEKGVRCNACRWFEARIFRELVLPDGVDSVATVDDPATVELGEYIIHYAGMSVVAGEVPFYRYETTRSAHAVIESMTTRRTTSTGPIVFLAKPAAYALAAAAGFDADLRDAYINRAVS